VFRSRGHDVWGEKNIKDKMIARRLEVLGKKALGNWQLSNADVLNELCTKKSIIGKSVRDWDNPYGEFRRDQRIEMVFEDIRNRPWHDPDQHVDAFWWFRQ